MWIDVERHMNRHKQKDEEAGGDGTGTLNTRKRMWKDHEGRIVQKKPIEHSSLDDGSPEASFVSRVDGPISPPISSNNSDLPSDSDPNQTSFSNDHSILPDYPLPTGQFGSQGSVGYWITTESQPQGLVSPYLEINYDEVFQPDTASSFNMPYTTQVNYDWLFNLDPNFPSTENIAQPPYVPSTSLAPYSCEPQQPQMPMNLSRANSSAEVGQYDVSTTESPLTSMASFYARSRGSTQNTTSPSVSAGLAPSLPSPVKQDFVDGFGGSSEVEFERPLAMLQSSTRLPSIDEYTYTRILDTIKIARPSAPDSSPLEVNSPLLSRSSLQTYCDLYFIRFNTAYPLIHQATFEPSQKESLLLLSIILLGATCE